MTKASIAESGAVTRSTVFLTTAMELMYERGGFDFTVHELVERSQLSLRSFYQHFGSKDELLLALLEEQMARFVDHLSSDLVGIEAPQDRLEELVLRFLERSERSPETGGRALTEFQIHLAVTSPDTYARSAAPLMGLIRSIVEEGVKTGAFRSDVSSVGITVIISSTLVSIAQMDILHTGKAGPTLTHADVVAWCRAATSAPAGAEELDA